MVRQLGTSEPFRLLDVARGQLRAAGEADAVNLLLVDYAQEALRPFGAYQGPSLGQERVDQGQAGLAYRDQATSISRFQLGWRVCVPVSPGGERFGVLDVQLSNQPGVRLLTELETVAMAVALSLGAAGRATNELELARRSRPLSLPAEIQWELLPRLALEAPAYAVAGTVEPAYDVGGDTFDYAAQPEALTVSVTDAMGHGLQAAPLAGLAVAALRNARRRPGGLLDQVHHANQALHEQFGGERFVTGQLLRVDIPGGTGAIINAGHPLPLRVRGGRVEPVGLDADLPLGLDGATVYHVQQLTLEPGDRLVFEPLLGLQSCRSEGMHVIPWLALLAALIIPCTNLASNRPAPLRYVGVPPTSRLGRTQTPQECRSVLGANAGNGSTTTSRRGCTTG